MATTGAPWNIPYVEPTDIPRTYPDDSEDLALAVAAGLSAAGNPGIGSNVVQTVKTDTFSTSSTSYVDVTGLTLNITPTSATSKILVVAVVAVGGDGTNSGFVTLADGSDTNLANASSPGSRIPAFARLAPSNTDLYSGVAFLLHSPATTSAFTYKVRMAATGGTTFVNQGSNDSDSSSRGRGVSTITAIEVAA